MKTMRFHVGGLPRLPRSLLRHALLAIGPAFALAACGDGGGGPSAPPADSVSEGASTFPNDQAAYEFFVGKGLTSFQAAGIVGNLDQESGVDPGAVQYGGGPGRGIAQWSVGGRWDSDSYDNVAWYAGQQGQNLGSLQLQLEFVWYELTTFSGYGLGALRASTTASGATVAFMSDFEICGQCDSSQRIAYADGVLAAYGEGSGGGGTASGAGAASGQCTSQEVTSATDKGVHWWTCEEGGFRYICDDKNTKVSEVCPAGCAPAGVDADDQCTGGAQPKCTSQEIAGQTSNVNGIPASFWTCEGGSRYVCDGQANKVAQACAAGCSPQGSGRDDVCACSSQLTGGAILAAGGSIASCDGRFLLTMQSDGNLVLYEGRAALWATGTNGRGAAYATTQGDGNLVLYDASHRPVWASHTSGHSGAYLVVQNDGNVVIYQGHSPLWTSNTPGH